MFGTTEHTVGRKVIGVDFDDVVVNTFEMLRRFHNQYYGTNHQFNDLSNYRLDQLWGCSNQEAFARIDFFYASSQHKATPLIEGAFAALERLSRQHTLVLITARPESLRECTEQLIGCHVPGIFSQLHFIGHPHDHRPDKRATKSKGDVCVEIGVDIFIEDAPENAFSIVSKNIPVLLLDKPWNKDIRASYIRRVHNWDEVLKELALQ